ncbi:MAG TPA: hypothetical protein VN836_11675 [Verrucomicrobiae bacterium]|nr:hypothetical protein [Verrucomicrobiae bacterium]
MPKTGKILTAAKFLAEICGGWWSLMSGAISIPLTFLALILPGAQPKELFVALAFIALWVFAIRAAWKNYQAGCVELEIEFINPTDWDTIIHRYPLRVKVTHTHSKKTVKNLRVLMTKIECPEWNKKEVKYLMLTDQLKKIKLPVCLPEAGSADNSTAHDVWPKPVAKTFDVFAVRMGYAESTVWIAPFGFPDDGHRDYWSKNEFSFSAVDVIGGHGKFTIELQVTADGIGTLSKTVVLDVSASVVNLQAEKLFEDAPLPRWII